METLGSNQTCIQRRGAHIVEKGIFWFLSGEGFTFIFSYVNNNKNSKELSSSIFKVTVNFYSEKNTDNAAIPKKIIKL